MLLDAAPAGCAAAATGAAAATNPVAASPAAWKNSPRLVSLVMNSSPDPRDVSRPARRGASNQLYQKSGTPVCGKGRAFAPGKNALGLSAQIISCSGPSTVLA